MNDTPHLVPEEVWTRPHSLAGLLNLIATWDKRQHYRRDLERLSKADPHLIEDIGLTRQQAEAEMAKPFWQA